MKATGHASRKRDDGARQATRPLTDLLPDELAHAVDGRETSEVMCRRVAIGDSVMTQVGEVVFEGRHYVLGDVWPHRRIDRGGSSGVMVALRGQGDTLTLVRNAVVIHDVIEAFRDRGVTLAERYMFELPHPAPWGTPCVGLRAASWCKDGLPIVSLVVAMETSTAMWVATALAYRRQDAEVFLWLQKGQRRVVDEMIEDLMRFQHIPKA